MLANLIPILYKLLKSVTLKSLEVVGIAGYHFIIELFGKDNLREMGFAVHDAAKAIGVGAKTTVNTLARQTKVTGGKNVAAAMGKAFQGSGYKPPNANDLLNLNWKPDNAVGNINDFWDAARVSDSVSTASSSSFKTAKSTLSSAASSSFKSAKSTLSSAASASTSSNIKPYVLNLKPPTAIPKPSIHSVGWNPSTNLASHRAAGRISKGIAKDVFKGVVHDVKTTLKTTKLSDIDPNVDHVVSGIAMSGIHKKNGKNK